MDQLAMDLSLEKGASSWLTTLPLKEHGFSLHKTAFRDALALRYGGFRQTSLQTMHAASLLKETCHNVAVEPSLQPITGEILRGASANIQDGARLDIKANGFWGGNYESVFFDVRVFNPFALSNRHSSVSAAYRHHENQKKRQYEQRVREVEHSSFTPLVFSLTGGVGPAASVFYKRFTLMLSEPTYCTTINWLRCRLGFSLLQSSIMCLRGARSVTQTLNTHVAAAVDLTITDSRLSV